MTGNPYSSPSQPSTLASAATLDARRQTLSHAAQTTWIATGLCLLVLTVASAIHWDRPVARLLRSDDSYCIAFAASVPVAAFFAMGTLAGWWFKSARVQWAGTMIPLTCFAGLLMAADAVHDFGEGDQIPGYLGAAIFVGGLIGSLAFSVRNTFIRGLLCFVPHLLVGTGYLIALASMSAW